MKSWHKYALSFLTGFLTRLIAPPVEGKHGAILTFAESVGGGFLATGLLRLPSPGGLKTPAIKGNTNKMAFTQLELTASAFGQSFPVAPIPLPPLVVDGLQVLELVAPNHVPAVEVDIAMTGGDLDVTLTVDSHIYAPFKVPMPDLEIKLTGTLS